MAIGYRLLALGYQSRAKEAASKTGLLASCRRRPLRGRGAIRPRTYPLLCGCSGSIHDP